MQLPHLKSVALFLAGFSLDKLGAAMRDFERAGYLLAGNRRHPTADEQVAHLANGALQRARCID